MTPRRLLPTVATLLLAASSFAQLTTQDKSDVLQEMDRVISQEAFVPGVDLGKWHGFLDARSQQLEDAETPRAFSMVINSALSELGISHIHLTPSRMRRGGYYGQLPQAQFQQGGGRRRQSAQLGWLGDDTAYMRLVDFNQNYSREQVEAMFDRVEKAKYLVLDLRGNPGGEVENMRHFLGMVVPADAPIGTFVSRRMAAQYERNVRGGTADPVAIAKWAKRTFTPAESDLGTFKGDIAVLVDEGTGSAAEIVANALREIRHSPILGGPSAGAVLVSTFEPLPHGFMMQFPISDYVSASGTRLEGRPIRPDVVLSEEDRKDTDAAANAARRELKGSR